MFGLCVRSIDSIGHMFLFESVDALHKHTHAHIAHGSAIRSAGDARSMVIFLGALALCATQMKMKSYAIYAAHTVGNAFDEYSLSATTAIDATNDRYLIDFSHDAKKRARASTMEKVWNKMKTVKTKMHTTLVPMSLPCKWKETNDRMKNCESYKAISRWQIVWLTENRTMCDVKLNRQQRDNINRVCARSFCVEWMCRICVMERQRRRQCVVKCHSLWQ